MVIKNQIQIKTKTEITKTKNQTTINQQINQTLTKIVMVATKTVINVKM